MILDHPVKIYAAGRTDAGVHAFGQVINFFTEKTIELVKLTKGLNSLLPADIRIKQGMEVDESFHARYSAKSKSYIYAIFNRPYLPPFNARYVWHIPYGVNSVLMNETIQEIVGIHDFSSFKKRTKFTGTMRGRFSGQGLNEEGPLFIFSSKQRVFYGIW